MEAESSLEAELIGIHKGLQIAKEMRMENIQVESDCLDALKLIDHGCPSNHPAFQMFRGIIGLSSEGWEIGFSHIYRENNEVADFLAQAALYYNWSSPRLWEPPDACQRLLRNDLNSDVFYLLCFFLLGLCPSRKYQNRKYSNYKKKRILQSILTI